MPAHSRAKAKSRPPPRFNFIEAFSRARKTWRISRPRATGAVRNTPKTSARAWSTQNGARQLGERARGVSQQDAQATVRPRRSLAEGERGYCVFSRPKDAERPGLRQVAPAVSLSLKAKPKLPRAKEAFATPKIKQPCSDEIRSFYAFGCCACLRCTACAGPRIHHPVYGAHTRGGRDACALDGQTRVWQRAGGGRPLGGVQVHALYELDLNKSPIPKKKVTEKFPTSGGRTNVNIMRGGPNDPYFYAPNSGVRVKYR